MARTARSLIREARAEQHGVANDNLPTIGDDGFRPDSEKTWSNPLSAFIDDETYELLEQHGVLYEKAIRDYRIRQQYREMRRKMSSSDAIETLREAHPYLQYDTIRKIIYAKAS